SVQKDPFGGFKLPAKVARGLPACTVVLVQAAMKGQTMTADSLMRLLSELAALEPRSAEALTAVAEELLALGPQQLSQVSEELSEQERTDMVREAFERHRLLITEQALTQTERELLQTWRAVPEPARSALLFLAHEAPDDDILRAQKKTKKKR